MSWIIALRPGQNAALLERAAALHGPAAFSTSHDSWYLACGGLAATASGGIGAGEAWIRCGVDLRTSDRSMVLHVPPEPRAHGRPAAGVIDLRAQGDRLELRSDQSGLRTAYVGRIGDAVIACTRLDWVSQLARGLDVDFEAFGSHWLCHNQLSWRPFLKGLHRLTPGGTITVEGSSIRQLEDAWSPDPASRPTDYESVLRDALKPSLPGGHRLSLGVSGGLDSRVLACIATEFEIDFHVFGSDDSADVTVARKLADALSHPIQVIDGELPVRDSTLDLARKHSVLTCAVAPASAALSLRHFTVLHQNHRVVIDGGFGEIGRRQFMNRLLTSRRPLSSRSPLEIAGALSFQRANVFSADVADMMRTGMLQDVEHIFADRPRLDGWTDADQADLVAVRYRLPNFFGLEQARLDGHVASYMPFATPGFLQTVFGTPMRDRRAGRVFRRMIRDLSPRASRLPLVKGSMTYPFLLSPLPAFAYTAIKGRLLRGTPAATPRMMFLAAVEEFVRDTVSSASIVECGFYDVDRLRHITDAHFSQSSDHSSELDWWLSFELWRQSLVGK
jgi:hypothetical protein